MSDLAEAKLDFAELEQLYVAATERLKALRPRFDRRLRQGVGLLICGFLLQIMGALTGS